MTTSYTSLLGLALPATGELSGTWGDTVNDAITTLLDSAVAGTTTITADADITLSDTDGSANETRQAIIVWATASGTTTRNITAPARSKAYIVINKATAAQSIVIRGAGPTTGVTLVQGEYATVAWNGSDFVKIANQNGTGNFTTLVATTGNITTVNATTVDTTNIEVTNLKAKDGTSAGSIADSTGVVTLASSVLTTTDINGGTIDNAIVGGATPAAGTFTTLGATTGNITTVNATTLDATNLEVTNLKAKDGTAAGSIANSTGVVTLASTVLTTTDINGGTIDGTVIGGASAAAGSFTTLTASTPMGPASGGTGVSNNAAATVTSSGNFAYTRTLTAGTNVTFPTTGTLATLAGSETLTNKRIDPRVVSAASASSLTPSAATADIYAYTALATGLTINAPTGTPVDGDKLIFRFLDNGTTRTLTWNATYTVIGTILPTSTTASKMVYVGCIYNAANTRWDVIASTTQA